MNVVLGVDPRPATTQCPVAFARGYVLRSANAPKQRLFGIQMAVSRSAIAAIQAAILKTAATAIAAAVRVMEHAIVTSCAQESETAVTTSAIIARI